MEKKRFGVYQVIDQYSIICKALLSYKAQCEAALKYELHQDGWRSIDLWRDYWRGQVALSELTYNELIDAELNSYSRKSRKE